MSNLPSTARVVIIGGGIVGVSALYHLARAGWRDCLLVERNELTAGSTWHAAGNVPTFAGDWSIMNMQRYSTELYRGLGEAVEYPINYHVTGSLRLAHSAERMLEFHRACGMGRRQGIGMQVLGVDELAGLYPFLQTHDLAGGLYDPTDGDIDPAQVTQALAKGARDLGAQIVRFCPVTGVRRAGANRGAEWVVATLRGEVRCEYVVNAAGYYAAEVGRMFGRAVPMMVMSHQYMLFETIPELAAWSSEAGRKLPLLRDVDSSYYLRQEKHGMNLGPYEATCRAAWATADEPMPDDFAFQLFPDDLDRLEWHLTDAMERVPILASAGLARVINGPIPYTPDGNPLIGPMPGVPNAFEACVFTFGIAQGGGAGKVLAEWVTEGRPEWDVWSCDPRRFTAFAAAPDYSLAKGLEVYGNEYAMHFPRRVWPAGRDRKLSPIHDRTRALGAQFAPYNGWERPIWYARPEDDVSEASTLTWRRDGPWQARVREECLAVRDAAGLLDLPGFSRVRLEGAGAGDWLSGLMAGALPRPGRAGLGYFADADGRIVTEMSVLTLDPDRFLLMTAAVAQWHDLDWLARHLPADGSIVLRDETDDLTCQLLTGPRSREILAAVTDADLAAPWLTHQAAVIAGRPCRLVRMSFAGELGWEIHAALADAPAIFEAVWAAGAPLGLRPFGMYALDCLRLEKGYRAWKADLSSDYTLLEAGLGRFVRRDGSAFLGRDALVAERARGPRRQLVTLTVEPCELDPPPAATIRHAGRAVGEVTSAGMGYRVGRLIALGMVEAALAVPGTGVEIEVYDRVLRAVVERESALWDPGNARLRA